MWLLFCALIMCTFRDINSLKLHKESMNTLYIECTSITLRIKLVTGVYFVLLRSELLKV